MHICTYFYINTYIQQILCIYKYIKDSFFPNIGGITKEFVLIWAEMKLFQQIRDKMKEKITSFGYDLKVSIQLRCLKLEGTLKYKQFVSCISFNKSTNKPVKLSGKLSEIGKYF